MKTELEKIRDGGQANMHDSLIIEQLKEGKRLSLNLNQTYLRGPGHREALEALVPDIPETSTICPPFYCDYGNGIILGENVFINMNCTFLDGGYITIGEHTLIGPNVQIYTPHHPIDADERRTLSETAYPVTIGKDCWIGGGAVICPGVTIGDRVIVGAGSVVTKNIPSDVVIAGSPAKVIKNK